MQQNIHTHQFDNGLMLIVEEMQDVQSAAFSFLTPAGSIYDHADRGGTGALLTDWITRGAGERDSRELFTALDNLGLQRSENIGGHHLTFSGSNVAGRVPECLAIYADIIRRPHLADEEFEAVQLGAEQALLAIEDEPQRKAMVELRRHVFTSPYGLPSDGSLEHLPNIDPDAVRGHFQSHVRPNGAIVGIAGNVDAKAMIDTVGQHFSDWEQKPESEIATGGTGPKRNFIEHDSAQTHIGVAYDSVAFTDPDYYEAWAAASVLSGGMSSRLFTEVRERRGLCYSVHASQASMKHEGRVLCYAGTSNDRAQETLDVTIQELKRLGDGIEQSELDRCVARAKSSLVMQQESSRGRASSLARNWFMLSRIRTLEEVLEKIESLTVESVLDFVHRMPAQDFTVLTLGPQALEVNE